MISELAYIPVQRIRSFIPLRTHPLQHALYPKLGQGRIKHLHMPFPPHIASTVGHPLRSGPPIRHPHPALCVSVPLPLRGQPQPLRFVGSARLTLVLHLAAVIDRVLLVGARGPHARQTAVLAEMLWHSYYLLLFAGAELRV